MTGSEPHQCPSCEQLLRPTSLFCPRCGTPIMPTVSNALQLSITQILASMKPGQAEVMRRCAIPRWFDAEILAVLRERDDGNNANILQQVAEYSFVRQIGEGRYAFIDDVRNYLLGDWRLRPDELRRIHERLYTYFERRMGSTMVENRATWLREIVSYDLLLASTSSVSQAKLADELTQPASTDPDVLTQAMTKVERALLRFRNLFDAAFNAHRMAEAEAILLAAEEQSNILVPLVRDWLLYYRGKMNFAMVRLDEAIECFEILLKRDDLDPELYVLLANSLGDVQVEAGQWSASILSYQKALATPKIELAQQAEAHLGIADAYNEIAVSAGGWHQPQIQKYPIARAFAKVFQSIAIIPMFLLVSILRRLGAAVPKPLILLRYQNWLLARIFRASREQTMAAYRIFRQQNDQMNLIRCEMRLIDIDVLFGSVDEAIELAKQSLERPGCEEPYRKARVQVTLARALIAKRDFAQAIDMLNQALTVFRAVDDGRWEARVLTTLGRALQESGQTEAALKTYQAGLVRARGIGSVLSRERILYELRTWRRSELTYPTEISTILRDEPTQRFVARFPRFLLPYLQVGQTLLIPLILVFAAIVAPTVGNQTIVQASNNLVLPAADVYIFPWYRLIISPLIMLVATGVGYSVLGLIVLWYMPMTQLRNNQPTVHTLTPDELIHYDSSGHESHRIKWADVTEIITADRRVWKRPLMVFSRSFVRSTMQPLLRVDGITGWYNSVIYLIEKRAREAGAQMSYLSANISLLRSAWGGVIGLGTLLLSLIIASVNGWIPNLAEFLPATFYAILQLVGFSGILLIGPTIFWTVIRPLRLDNEFALDERLPSLAAMIGFIVMVLFIITDGAIVRVPIFSVSLFIAGVYVFSEGIYQLGVRRGKDRRWRTGVTIVGFGLLLGAMLIVRETVWREFYHARSYAYAIQGNGAAAADDRLREVAQTSLLFERPMVIEEAVLASQNSDWEQADQQYTAIVNNRGYDARTQALAYHNWALTELARCKKNSCSEAELARIAQFEATAIELIDQAITQHNANPEERAVLLEAQGTAYIEVGQIPAAIQKLTEALASTSEPQAQQRIRELLNSLQR
ncbi:tetratricopeptide repeat protein [Herpetosiphon geysericola]|uniref:Tetratricopeptide repeat protein n=1 Tax=Herpetosiphon geysericola TaxID=70996 RepID=A0A0P6YGT6_9CHLR|nr:tetratricopeptide repeat protein [Herpetosiphon geysericola]KPL91427.1 hypothetical protein SE18_01875 [Herpetosiphon geysericola]